MEAVRAYDNKCPREVAEILVKAGAELDRQDSHGFTALHWLASRNCVQPYVDALKYLLAQGADPTIRDYQCRTPLELAAEQGCVDKMKPLALYMKKTKPRPPRPNDPCRRDRPSPELRPPSADQE
jgi:ankyrin repeat protein